jgi:hypothetical protein
MLATVTALRDPWEAHMLCARLNAEGIPATIAHQFHIWVSWDLSNALGGTKVQVPWYWREEAEAIEALCRDGFYKTDLAREYGDLDDVRCPHCGGLEYRKRRPLIRAAVAVLVSLFCGSVFPPKGWIYRCEGCGREYRYRLCPGGTWLAPFALTAAIVPIVTAAVYVLLFPLALFFETWTGLIVTAVGVLMAVRWAITRKLDAPDEADSEGDHGSGEQISTR